jgi:hypothetical protein
MWSRSAAAALGLLAASACREEPAPAVATGKILRVRADSARSLLALVPSEARVGEVFQRQPNGRAALAVLGTGFAASDVIYWDGHPLGAFFGNSRLLTATLPPELLEKPGDVEVTVASPVDPKLSRLRATFRLRAP